VEKYYLSKKVPRRGLIFLLLALLGAVLVGILAFGFAQILYIVILFPVVMGVLGGLLNLLVIGRGKVRCSLTATILGFCTGIVIFGAYLYPGYWLYRANYLGWENNSDLQEQTANEEEFQRSLRDKTGSTGFWGFLRNEANSGLMILGSRTYLAEGSRLQIKGAGVWLNWLLELVIICSITISLARWRVFWPFSELSDRWFNRATRLGTINQSDVAQAQAILNEGRLVEFIDLVQSQAPVVPGGWEVHFKRCGDDFSEVALTIGKAVVIRRKLKLRQQQAWLLDRQDLETVAGAIRQKHGAAPGFDQSLAEPAAPTEPTPDP
jgi:hypothetical protein